MDEATYIALSEAHMASFFRMAYSILRNRSDAEDAVQQALMTHSQLTSTYLTLLLQKALQNQVDTTSQLAHKITTAQLTLA